MPDHSQTDGAAKSTEFPYPIPQERQRLVEVAKSFETEILAAEPIIENERTVPQYLTEGLYDAGIYRAFMPRELGGVEAHPNEWLEAVEELSRVNGSIGWLCMLHTGATWAKPEKMREILSEKRWIIAGNVGRAAGTARKVEGGYIFEGRWPFCSGSPEATYLFGRSVLLAEDGSPMKSPKDGLPYYLTGYIPAESVILHDTWDGLGLRGTGSGDIEVPPVFVPNDMVNESGIWSHPYDSPLQHANFNLAAHAAHALGLAVAAKEEVEKLAQKKAKKGSFRQERMGKEQSTFLAVGRADAKIRAMRLFMQDVIFRAFEDAKMNRHIDYELRVLMHEVNAVVVSVCREVVDDLFQEAGSIALFRGNRMERIFRDMMTAAQHIVVVKSSIDRAGQYWMTKNTDDGPSLDIELSYVRGPHPQSLRAQNA